MLMPGQPGVRLGPKLLVVWYYGAAKGKGVDEAVREHVEAAWWYQGGIRQAPWWYQRGGVCKVTVNAVDYCPAN